MHYLALTLPDDSNLIGSFAGRLGAGLLRREGLGHLLSGGCSQLRTRERLKGKDEIRGRKMMAHNIWLLI